MKKVIYSTLSVALLTAGLISCGKSSKGKMVNEWKITSMEESSTNTSASGYVSKDVTTYTETTYQNTTTNGSNPSTSTDGKVITHTMTISKDGTWTMNRETSYQYTTPLTNKAHTVTRVISNSGTWSFVGKTKGDEFKKNERVLFNTLSTSTTVTDKNTTDNQSTTDVYSDTYATGENPLIYTVVESKAKELQLEALGDNSSTQNTSTSKYISSTKITMVQ